MNHHCAKGTKLLTAEALDALFAVDDRLAVNHGDGHSRADLLALFAALAVFFLYYGLCFKSNLGDLTEKLGFVVEKQASTDGNVLIVGNDH